MKNNYSSQIKIITKIIASACLLSILLSYNLWLGDRMFPLTPVLDFLPALHHPIDIILFIITSLLLICIAVFNNPKKFIVAFLICALILSILDQNRWQPWFYQYILMFFVIVFYDFNKNDSKHSEAIITILKLMIGTIYFWSGLQKLNPHFITDTYPWLMEPITNHMTENGIRNIDWLGKAFPLIEVSTGIALFFSRTKKLAVTLLFLMHLFILYVLGPFGHNYNPVVWPWNVAMMLFAYFLFMKNDTFKISQIKNMFTFHSIKIVTVLFILLPLFNFFNAWDSYLSHNLYSGNTSNGVIYLSDAVESKLPPEIKQYSKGEMNLNQITIKYWCMMELGVPAYPEKRNFVAVTKTFYKYAIDSSEIYFMFTPKLKLSELSQGFTRDAEEVSP